MSEAAPVRGILVAHGSMAQGMVDAVKRIAGVGEDALTALSNDGKSPEALVAELNQLLGSSSAVVFTDLASGSCALAARACCRNGGSQVVLFGVNLPILLDFVFHRELPLEELIPRLLEKGRGSLRSAPEFPPDAHRSV